MQLREYGLVYLFGFRHSSRPRFTATQSTRSRPNERDAVLKKLLAIPLNAWLWPHCRIHCGSHNNSTRESQVNWRQKVVGYSIGDFANYVGAMQKTFAWRESSMWGWMNLGSHIEVRTGYPLSASNVLGATNWVAASVMTTETSTPALTRKLVRVAALKAAIPPATPSKTLFSSPIFVSRP